MEQITKEIIAPLLKEHDPGSSKKDHGRLAIAAGSLGMMGAAVFCGKAAMRSGVGLASFVHVGEEELPILQAACPEVMCDISHDISEGLADGHYTALAAGPGLGQAEEEDHHLFSLIGPDAAFDPFRDMFGNTELPVVADADLLNAMAKRSSLLDAFRNADIPKVITPHEGEAARLMKIDAVEDRENAAVRLAKGIRGVAVLKGPNTLVATQDGEVWENTTGNAGLATGGSGDVLTGMIGSFLAQGHSALDAARMGVYLHGMAADLALPELGTYGMTPMDVIDKIPAAILMTMKAND